jgi:ribonuclease BN (tRNA processing enzyme)
VARDVCILIIGSTDPRSRDQRADDLEVRMKLIRLTRLRICGMLSCLAPFVFVAALSHAAFAQQTGPSSSSQTRVVVLGTGTPQADPDNSGPAVAVVINQTAYLVDCGPGVVRRAAAAERKGVGALAPQSIRVVFITHLHSDHTLGYPDLIFSPWVLGRAVPLEVYGPRGLQDMTDHIEKAWEKDIDVRTNGLEQGNRTGYKVQVHEIRPGIVYKDKNVTVSAFLVPHGSWDQAFGYRFETADRTIVFSGDTAPTDAVGKACHGCDVLLHEVYSETSFSIRSPQAQKYFRSFHTSSFELAKEATEAKPGLLVLYHQMYGDDVTYDHLLAEVKQHYSGTVVSARDLDIY